MTDKEAIAYFIDNTEYSISAVKDENRYNYETQQIEDIFMRRDFEAKELAIRALEQTRWIPVTERLPEDLQQVLVTISDGDKLLKVTTCMYTIPSSLFWKDYVTAWMPLPQPYKAESEV